MELRGESQLIHDSQNSEKDHELNLWDTMTVFLIVPVAIETSPSVPLLTPDLLNNKNKSTNEQI